MDRLDRAALEFVASQGNAFDCWRARRLLTGPDTPAPAGWAADQTPEGGWRSLEMNYQGPNMGRTSNVLLMLTVAGLMGTPEAGRTIGFLWETQQPDGRWTEDPAQLVGDPPEWNRPGDLTVDIWETANVAAVLAANGFAHDPRTERALDWLNTHVTADGSFPGYIHATYAMAALHTLRDERDRADHYLQASDRILKTSQAEPWFDTMDLTWPLMLWSMAGISRRHPVVRAFLEALYGRRLPDGTWPTRYAGFEPSFTLEALEVKYLHAYA